MEIIYFFDRANQLGTTMLLKKHVNVEFARMAGEPRVKKNARRLSEQRIDDASEEFHFCEEMLSERNVLRHRESIVPDWDWKLDVAPMERPKAFV